MRGVSPIPGFLYFLGSSSSLSQVHLCFDSQNTQYILNEIPSRVVSPAGSLSASLPGCVLAVALPHTIPLSLSLSLMLSTSRSFPPPLSIALSHSLPLSLPTSVRSFLPGECLLHQEQLMTSPCCGLVIFSGAKTSMKLQPIPLESRRPWFHALQWSRQCLLQHACHAGHQRLSS